MKEKKAIKNNKKKNDKIKKQNQEKFNFDNEIVIGVTPKVGTKKVQKRKLTEKEKKNIEIKKKILKLFFSIILFIIILIGLIAFLLLSPIFNISQIQITGNHKLSNNTYISLSGIEEGKNIYKFSKKQAINNIKENTYVESATIKRALPNTIEISVKERVATYMLKLANSYVYINNQGYILEVKEEPLELPIIIGYKSTEEDILNNKRLNDNDLSKLEKVLKITESANSYFLAEMIEKIDIEDKNNYTLIFKDGKKAYLGEATNLSDKMAWIKTIIENEGKTKGEIFVNVDLNSKNPYFREEI